MSSAQAQRSFQSTDNCTIEQRAQRFDGTDRCENVRGLRGGRGQRIRHNRLHGTNADANMTIWKAATKLAMGQASSKPKDYGQTGGNSIQHADLSVSVAKLESNRRRDRLLRLLPAVCNNKESKATTRQQRDQSEIAANGMSEIARSTEEEASGIRNTNVAEAKEEGAATGHTR